MTVFEYVKKALAQLVDVEEDSITMETDLEKDLGVDSLDAVEFFVDLEKDFNLFITKEQATKLPTVGQIVGYIEENKK